MPVYKAMNIPSQWIPEGNLTKGSIFLFRQYVYNAKKKFKYRKDSNFLDSILPNTLYDKPYLYTYDVNRCDTYDNTYPEKLQELIKASNQQMKDDIKNRFDKYYKFDIMGTWEQGMIILMKPRDMNIPNLTKKVYKASKGKIKKMGKDLYQDMIDDYLYNDKWPI